MALSLLYGKRYDKGKVGTIELDVTLREVYTYTSKVTTYPVESGSIISDHIINDPIRLVLEGIVTDSPLSILSFFNRSIDAFNRLIDIHKKREVVTVVTGLKTYEGMAITSLNVPRDLTTGQSLTFSIELQEILKSDNVDFVRNPENIYGVNQTKISRDQVSTGENIPILSSDPTGSLKDQATSGTNIGIQNLQNVSPTTETFLSEGRLALEAL